MTIDKVGCEWISSFISLSLFLKFPYNFPRKVVVPVYHGSYYRTLVSKYTCYLPLSPFLHQELIQANKTKSESLLFIFRIQV